MSVIRRFLWMDSVWLASRRRRFLVARRVESSILRARLARKI